MSEFIGTTEQVDPLKPIETDNDVTEDHFKQSLQALDNLAVQFDYLGDSLAKRKKKGNFRVLRAILFETEETNKTFGKQEALMLDLSRKIMYHRQIVEIFLMKQENENFLKELKNG